MSFARRDYERLIKISRILIAMDGGEYLDELAHELFNMTEAVIGQQSPPLQHEPEEV